MDSPVQKIKERLSITDVVSSYLKLEQAGSNWKARCPFHNEKTPSFFVSPDRGSFYCFGCGQKGDIFTFVEEFEGLDFKGALKLLADRAGVPLTGYNPREESEKEKLYGVMEAAASFYESNFKDASEIADYLRGRGLADESAKNFRVGWAREEWRDLYAHLRAGGWTDDIIERAGLAKRSEKGFYDRFRGRIMFPISDSSGRVIAFSGRIYRDDPSAGSGPKYLNSPDTPIFQKSGVLYGLDRAKESIRKNNFSILVEGQMDLIMSHQAGFKNTVASSGTALSDATEVKEDIVSNLGLVRRLSSNIILAYDADRAGQKAALRAAKIALTLGMDVKIANMPEGADPAELIQKAGPGAWRTAVRESKHVIDYLLGKILAGADGRKAGKEIRDTVLPYVAMLPSAIEQAHFLRRIADESAIPEAALRDDLARVDRDETAGRKEIGDILERASGASRKDYIEDRLLGIILWQRGLAEGGKDMDTVLREYAEILGLDPEQALARAGDRREDLIFQAEVFYGSGADPSRDIAELLGNFREEYLREDLAKCMRELDDIQSDSARSAEIIKSIDDINKKIQDIKSGRRGTNFK